MEKNLIKVLKFQINRGMVNLAKESLNILELNHEYIKSLEQTLIKMGIDEEKYINSKFNFQKDRAIILRTMNNTCREVETQIDMASN